ncbi:Dioxygenase [Geodermatophilus siccatus]|uniref:Dioxygenase n=1 Tax=Geodermatophilus siccatus TaxID=1137991 RepID=A0A1G9VX39_9ACTN|nr:hypothetical protein [Geodermatophilus siccatus]SDM76804.1 Dioxygenase [Geodermatophilus siccatus]
MLEQSGIVRSDIRSSFGEYSGTAQGVPMTLELTVSDLADGGVPFEGVAVYVWHCTREGGYSLYSAGIEDQNHLRGVQVADADGLVRFTSVVPACYDGAGRTFTSRSTRTRAAPPTRPTPSPPRRSRCRRTSARRSTRPPATRRR